MSVIQTLVNCPRGAVLGAVGGCLRADDRVVDCRRVAIEALGVAVHHLDHVHVVHTVVNHHGRCREQVDVVVAARFAQLLQRPLHPVWIPALSRDFFTQFDLRHPGSAENDTGTLQIRGFRRKNNLIPRLECNNLRQVLADILLVHRGGAGLSQLTHHALGVTCLKRRDGGLHDVRSLFRSGCNQLR